MRVNWKFALDVLTNSHSGLYSPFETAGVYWRFFFMGALGSSVKMFINLIFCSLYISYRSKECVL